MKMKMMSFVSVILVSVLTTLLPYLVGGQVSCPKPVYVGNTISSTVIPNQSGHGKPQTVVLYGPEFTIPCTCGVITGWDIIRYDNLTDGCAKYAYCNTTMVAYRNVVTSPTLAATVVGTYSVNINAFMPNSPPNKPYFYVPMARAEWIPVQYGDALGWSGQIGSVIYYDEPCGGSCPSGLSSSNKFLFTSNTTGVTTGSTVKFTNGPAYSYPNNRYYGFRAVVYQGTNPYFSYVAQTISIVDTTPVGTIISTVVGADAEPKQTVTLSILRSCPQTSYFSIDPVTGDISVNQSLIGSESVHILTIEVSDGCLQNTSDVAVRILTSSTATTDEPDTSTVSTPSAKNILDSGPGYGLIASTAVSCVAAIAASVGVCVFCSQLSNLQNQLDLVKGVKPKAYAGRKSDGRFLYNGTDDILKDPKKRAYPDLDRKSAEYLDSSPSIGSPRPISPASVHMSSGGHGSPI